MKRQENRWNNAYIDQLRQKQSVIKSKRKLTELIIDELEDSDSTENVVAAQQKSLKQPCLETNSIDEIDDDYEGLEWKRKSSKPAKVAVDELITQTNSDRSKPHRRLIDLVEFDDNEEIDESSPNLIKETGFMKQSKPQYDIDEILEDEDDSSHSRNRINIARKKINQSQSSVKSEKLVIEEAVLSEFEINRNPNKSASKRATTSKKSVDIDSFLSLSLEEEEKTDMKNEVKEEEAIENDVSQALLSTSFAPTRRNKNSHLMTREYNIENLLEDEEEVEKGEDTDIMIAMKTSGTEWLKKLNEKLANASATYLNGDNLNSTVITTDVKKTTSPPSLLTVNTSNMYLNENDIKKRKAKFIKNGFAEKLQKLLIRQASSINFVKHCMAKKSTNEQITQFKNVPNIIKAIPIYKQTSITGHNFSLIHAIQINDDRDIKREDYVYLLISNDKCDVSKYFEKSSFAKANIQINIYPPWRKMLLKDCNQSIYFSADLIEVTELNSNIKPTISRSKQHSIHDLTCPQCLNSSDSCNLVLFDPNLFMRSMSTLVNHRTTNSSFTVFSNSQAHSNYMFHTQNDADYYNRVNQPTEARSQYIALNSILDALDHVGYYGFVTFRACVQRVSSPIDSSSNFSSSGLTQKTNTQITQRTTQFTQNYSHKRELIVSDKCGMFALIWLPLTTCENSSNTENCDVKESQKYQFNSLKFIEKQALTERDHPVLYEQVNFLWHEMNKSREKRCKVQVKSFQRFIYVFEFVTQSRSSIESLGHSNSYLPLIGFSSLRKVISQTDNNMTSYFFDLNDVVLLKMIHNSTMPIRIYLIDKISAYSSSQPSAEIKCIEFLSIDQIKDGRILEALEKNSILYKSDDCVLCLKNVFIRNSDIEMVHSNLYSSIVSISRSDLAEKSSYSISNEANLINRFLNDTFIDLSQRRRNNGYEFVKIEGSLLNLCEDSSLIVLVCLRCNKSHPKDCLSIPLNINIVRALYCESCGSTCDPTNNPAQIELKLSVYLNCIGVYQSVRVDLHPTTTSSLISMDRLKQAFKSKSCHEIQSNVFDYFKPLVNKSIGPLLCFLTFSDDTRIEAQELMLNEN